MITVYSSTLFLQPLILEVLLDLTYYCIYTVQSYLPFCDIIHTTQQRGKTIGDLPLSSPTELRVTLLRNIWICLTPFTRKTRREVSFSRLRDYVSMDIHKMITITASLDPI